MQASLFDHSSLDIVDAVLDDKGMRVDGPYETGEGTNLKPCDHCK